MNRNRWGTESKRRINKDGFSPLLKKFLMFAEDRLPNSKIIYTMRSAKEQLIIYENGNSKCDGYKVISKHQLGKAFDIVPHPRMWNATNKEWDELNFFILKTLVEFNARFKCDLQLVWGGSWKTLNDKAHYEIRE